MKFRIQIPSGKLSPFVKHYWMLETCISNQSEYIHRIVPNGLFELTFYLNGMPVSADSSRHIFCNSQFTGQLKDYFDIKINGNLSLFSVYFKPQGLCMFLDIPLKELYNQVIPLSYFFKKDSERLEEELQKSNSFEDRIIITERFLINRIRQSKNNYEFKRINHCIELINYKKGLVNIGQLASNCCLSRKQFERTFSDKIGTSPKQFIKIVRFQNAVHERSVHQGISLTELAYKCGYYDQSHMVADFVSLSGLTPKLYFKNCESFSDYHQ